MDTPFVMDTMDTAILSFFGGLTWVPASYLSTASSRGATWCEVQIANVQLIFAAVEPLHASQTSAIRQNFINQKETMVDVCPMILVAPIDIAEKIKCKQDALYRN